jgi:hypothetical protein
MYLYSIIHIIPVPCVSFKREDGGRGGNRMRKWYEVMGEGGNDEEGKEKEEQ